MFNDALRRHILDLVTGSGFKAVAPLLDPRYGMTVERSNWSERHVAFIAGLGTFSLAKNLITSRGCAGRFGSVVVSMELKPWIIGKKYWENPKLSKPATISM